MTSAAGSLLIRHAQVVNHDRIDHDCDVLVEDGKIVQVGPNLQARSTSTRVIDAKGLLLMPGGIDPHTHMYIEFMGTRSCDDFESGTKAALAGGTTMIIDFVLSPNRYRSLIENFNQYRGYADPKVVIDYALHVCVLAWNDTVRDEMRRLCEPEFGVNSFKVFMAYKHAVMLEPEQLYDFMAECKSLGALAMLHAEDGDLIEKKAHELFDRGVRGPEGHVLSRPEEVEATAVHRAITTSDLTGCPIYIVHVMSKNAGLQIAQARRERKLVFGETIAAGIAGDGNNYYHKCWNHAARYVLSPPMRTDPTNGEMLMSLVSNGDLQTTGSDHCTFTNKQKEMGKHDFRLIPNGVNGVEERMIILWERGVRTGKLDVCQFVAASSTNSARLFNLYPRKGAIQPGSDADLVLWDPEKTRTVSAATHHSMCDGNVFEGFTSRGAPSIVISQGRVMFENDAFTEHVKPGIGRYIKASCHADAAYNRVPFNDACMKQREQGVKREDC